MTPLPKRKLSKGRRGRRRNSYNQAVEVTTVLCTNCKSQKLPHRACKNCGK